MMKTLSPLKAGLFAILASSTVFATTVSAESTQGCDHSRVSSIKKATEWNMAVCIKCLKDLI